MTGPTRSLPDSVLSGDHVVICFAACWIVFAVSAPLTYVGGAHWLQRAVQLGRGKSLVRPGWTWGTMGGIRTLVFQALSVGSWAGSCAVVVPILFANRHDWMSSLTVELLVAAAAVGSVSSELFQVSAVLVFDPAAKPLRILKGLQQGHTDVFWDVKLLPSAVAASYVVIGMGSLWVALGAALLHLAANVLEDAPSRLVYLALSATCLTMAAFVTHGLAGHLRYSRRESGSGGESASTSESENESADYSAGAIARQDRAIAKNEEDASVPSPGRWHFFQPFKGGGWFVATQALGWALYSAGLSLIIYLMAHGAAGIVHSVQRFTQTTGVIMVASHLVLACSLMLFKGPAQTMRLVRGFSASLSEQARPINLQTRLTHALTIVLLYAPVHLLCTIIALYFVFLPADVGFTLLIASAFVYYSVTLIGGPIGETGRREWPAFRDWFGEKTEEVLPSWLGSLEVIRDGPVELYDPEKRYVFGFAVHGLYPLAAGYLPLLPTFHRLLPGIRPVTLCASVVFIVPVLRDLLAWLGLRIVSRRSFLRAVREKGAVMLVPGFVRLALQGRAALIPVLAMGEVDSLHNLVNLPKMLRWTYKRLGFPIPYLVAGRWKFSPFPRPTGLRFVIGKPIWPQEKIGPEGPTEEQVDEAHHEFYNALEDLFNHYAPTFPGYEDVKLCMIDKE